MPKDQFDYRELLTIADLVCEKLEDERDGPAGSYQRRSLVRLALALDQQGRDDGSSRLCVLDGAPGWVYQYLGRGIIDLAPAPTPKKRPAAKAARTRKSGSGDDE